MLYTFPSAGRRLAPSGLRRFILRSRSRSLRPQSARKIRRVLAADHIAISIELIEFRAMITSSERPRRDDWTAPLRARFPMAKSAGFECFQGWQTIVTRMLERLEAGIALQSAAFRRGLKVEGIRQKFGALSVYLSKVPTPEVQAVLDEALAASLITCEVCGAPGRLADRRAWTSVKC